jgi:hypothetical protein
MRDLRRRFFNRGLRGLRGFLIIKKYWCSFDCAQDKLGDFGGFIQRSASSGQGKKI